MNKELHAMNVIPYAEVLDLALSRPARARELVHLLRRATLMLDVGRETQHARTPPSRAVGAAVTAATLGRAHLRFRAHPGGWQDPIQREAVESTVRFALRATRAGDLRALLHIGSMVRAYIHEVSYEDSIERGLDAHSTPNGSDAACRERAQAR